MQILGKAFVRVKIETSLVNDSEKRKKHACTTANTWPRLGACRDPFYPKLSSHGAKSVEYDSADGLSGYDYNRSSHALLNPFPTGADD